MGPVYTVPKQPQLLRFPTRMEDYQIIRELGRGRFGVVFEVKVREGKMDKVKVIDEVRGQAGATHYAMKKIRVTGTMDDIHTELANHKALPPHPNIENFYQFFQQGQEVCFIFELCDGGTLNDYVIRDQPSATVKASLMVDMASGLAHLHRHNIVHRDIKPNNILLTLPKEEMGYPRAKISDLGISRLCIPGMDRKNSKQNLNAPYMSTSCGSLPFEAPEVVKHHYTEKCDVFSMGLVFYVMHIEAVSLDSSGRKLLIPAIRAQPLNYFCYAHQNDITRILNQNVTDLSLRILLDAMLKRAFKERMSAQQTLKYLKDYIAKT